jgi:hypothetical protein
MVARQTVDTEAGGPAIRWEAPIPLVTSRFFMGDSLLAITVAVLLAYASIFVMALIVNGEVLLMPWQFGAALWLFFMVLFPLIALGVFQNRIDASFAVSEAGFEIAGGTKLRRVNRVVLILALLGGRPAAIGPAMLATADERRAIPWGDVRTVRYHPRDCVIELRDSIFRMNRLFCPADRYEAIEARVRAEIACHPRPVTRVDWADVLKRVGWSALVAVGWVLAVAWDADRTFPWITGAAIAAAAGCWIDWWLGRLVGGVALTAALVAAGMVVVAAFEATHYEGLFTIYGYDRDSDLLAITCVGLFLLAAIGLRRLISKPLG